MTEKEINTLRGQTIIARRKMFIGDKPNYDVEFYVVGIFEKSVMCKNKNNKAFIPLKFFLEERAELKTPEKKPIVYLPHWFHY